MSVLYSLAVVLSIFCSDALSVDRSQLREIHRGEGFIFFLDPNTGDHYVEFSDFDDESGETLTDFVLYASSKKIKPTVKVSVGRAGTSFSYSYTIANDRTAIQDISMCLLDGKIPVSNFASPPRWKRWERAIEPGWLGWNNNENYPTPNAIKPGASLGGFDLTSASPPILRKMRLKGMLTEKETEKDVVYSVEPPQKLGKPIKDIIHNDTNRYVFISTLGPSESKPLDAPFLCDTFILDLISQVREAVTAGWIKHDLRKDQDKDDDHGKRKGDDKGKKKGHDKDDDEGDNNGDDDDLDDADKQLPGAAKSIIKKLTKVRRECMRGKFGGAREKLRALIRQVNAQRGKHLTEEAYALIRFNAEFLLEKL